MKNLKPIRNPGILWKAEEQETLIFDPDTGNILVLNPTASLIWQLCDGKHSTSQLVSEILQKFEELNEETAKKDLTEFLSNAKKLELVAFKE